MPTKFASFENQTFFERIEAARVAFVTGKANSICAAGATQGISTNALYNAARRDQWKKQRADFHQEKLIRESIPSLAAALNPPGAGLAPISLRAPEPLSAQHFIELNQRYVSQVDGLFGDIDRIDTILRDRKAMTHDEQCNLLRTKNSILERIQTMLGIPNVAAIKRPTEKVNRRGPMMPIEVQIEPDVPHGTIEP